MIEGFCYFGALDPCLKGISPHLSLILAPNGPQNVPKISPDIDSKIEINIHWKRSRTKKQAHSNFGRILVQAWAGQKILLPPCSGPREPTIWPGWTKMVLKFSRNSQRWQKTHFQKPQKLYVLYVFGTRAFTKSVEMAPKMALDGSWRGLRSGTCASDVTFSLVPRFLRQDNRKWSHDGPRWRQDRPHHVFRCS